MARLRLFLFLMGGDMRSLIIIFIFLIIPFQSAFSAEYKWRGMGNNAYFFGVADSPLEACKLVYPTASPVKQADTLYHCYDKSNWVKYGFAERQGNECPPDYTYQTTDPNSPTCLPPEPDPCEAKNGESTTFTKSGTAPDAYSSVSGGYVHPNQSACFGGCVVSTSDQKCTGLTTGKYTCVGKAYYTGQQCEAQPVVDFTDSPEPEPQTINEEKPCQYIEQANGTLRCDSAKSTEKEGQFCGEVDGVKKCYDAKPTKNGVDISTEVKTETNPDGSTTTTKTDTATHTTCSGVNSCTSTTTTTTTTTNKNAGGGTTSVTGSCTGPACPDKNTNPDGDGDGFGDCVGGDCSGSGDGSGSPELEEVASFGESTRDFVDRVGGSPIMTAIDGIGLNGSGSCSMSSGTTIIGTIDASSFCDNAAWLNPLYYVFLAIHALVAVRVFLSA